MKRTILMALVLALAGCATARAAIVTTTYEFIPDQSIVEIFGEHGWSYPCPIEGQFQLTVDYDAGIASFSQVDATLSEEIHFYDIDSTIYTDSLDVLFHMTEMVSTSVSDTEISFIFEKNIPGFSPYADVHLTATFQDNSVQLIGSFYEPVNDGFYFHLDAVAVPEPATLFLLGLGGLMLKKRK